MSENVNMRWQATVAFFCTAVNSDPRRVFVCLVCLQRTSSIMSISVVRSIPSSIPTHVSGVLPESRKFLQIRSADSTAAPCIWSQLFARSSSSAQPSAPVNHGRHSSNSVCGLRVCFRFLIVADLLCFCASGPKTSRANRRTSQLRFVLWGRRTGGHDCQPPCQPSLRRRRSSVRIRRTARA